MKRDSLKSWLFAVLLILGAVAQTSSALAQSGGSYSVTSSSIDSGGGTSSSSDGRYKLSGTIGQPDAGTLSGGLYTVDGGFWGGVQLNVVPALARLAWRMLLLLLGLLAVDRVIRRHRHLQGSRDCGPGRV